VLLFCGQVARTLLPVAFFAACMLMLRHYVDFTISLHILSRALWVGFAMLRNSAAQCQNCLWQLPPQLRCQRKCRYLEQMEERKAGSGKKGRRECGTARASAHTMLDRRLLLWHTQKLAKQQK